MTNQGSTWNEYEDHALTLQQYKNTTLEDRLRKLRHLERNGVTLYPRLNMTEAKYYLSRRRRTGTTGGTLNHYVKAINSLLMAQGRRAETLPLYKTYYKQIQAPTNQEIQTLLQGFNRSHQEKRTKTMTYLAIHSGLRCEELCTLQFKHLDFKKNQLKDIQGKGDKTRTITLPPHILDNDRTPSLRNYIDHWRQQPTQEKDEIFLWIHEDGSPVEPWQYRKELKKIGRRVGLPWIHPHALRHYYATRLLRAGIDIDIVQYLMGHSSIRTTARYLHIQDQDVKKALSKLNINDIFKNNEEDTP